jgi:hypothetical protein
MITTFSDIKKPIRTYKGATLELMPITEADCGIVKNGEAKFWKRNTGLWSQSWSPVEGETARVINAFRKDVNRKIKLMAAARAKAAARLALA